MSDQPAIALPDPGPGPAPAPTAPSPPVPASGGPGRIIILLLGVVALVAVASGVLAWNARQRLVALEQELVKRQQDSGAQAAEARVLARQAEDAARDAAAKVAILEARLAESALQRTQLEELIQALSRSRDENLLSDLEAALRVAVQQSAITGSAEPLIAALRQADERLARNAQPRLERVRRAVVHDLDRAKAVGGTDVVSLTIKLDEAVRVVDELPLLATPERRAIAPETPSAASAVRAAASGPAPDWLAQASLAWQAASGRMWNEVRSLVRVTRIDNPEAMLVTPEQAFYLRGNLKLRLLNARLAVLSRQFDTAQSDLRDAQSALDRYFDRSSRRVSAASELVRQVAAQARLVTVPRPDESLAALAAMQAGR